MLGSAGFFGVVVTLAACAIDPAVNEAYLTPKVYALLVASAGALLLWAAPRPTAGGGGLRFTAIEAILAVNILWGVIVNPHWIATREGNWFWPSLAAFLLTVVVRQLFNLPKPEAAPPDEPAPRTRALADFMAALWIVGSALALHGLAQALAAGGFQPEGGAKTSVTSVIGTPNGFGAFMAVGIIAALASAAQARRRRVRLLLAGAALLQLVALLGNGSRGALLGLFAACLLVLSLRPLLGTAGQAAAGGRVIAGIRGRGRRALVAGLAVLVAVPLAGIVLNRLNPDSGRGRLIAWEISGAMLADRPLTGVGTGRFGLEWSRYQAEFWRQPGYAKFDHQAVGREQPNSELFHQLAERGLPGGALYVLLWACALGFLVRALARGEETSALGWGLLALLVAILVHSLVDGALQWVATLVTAHLAFGLIPAPALLRANFGRKRARKLAMAVGVGWAALVVVKTACEYPGYQLWEKALRGGAVGRLELLMRAHHRLPSEPSLSHELGIDLLAAGQPGQAVSMLQEGLGELDSHGSYIRLALAEAQLEVGWLEPAERNARTAAASYPDRLRPRLLLARIHHAHGDDAEARAALASCIRRETYFRSAPVDSVVTQATLLWRRWYDDEPPH